MARSLADIASRLARDGAKVELAGVGRDGATRTCECFVCAFVPPDGLAVSLVPGTHGNDGPRHSFAAVLVRDGKSRQLLRFNVVESAPGARASSVLLRLRPEPRRIEHRRHLRAAVAAGDMDADAVLGVAMQPATARVIDISEGGACIAAPVAALPRGGLQPGATILVRLWGKAVGRPADDPIPCSAVVRRVSRPVGGRVRLGVEFLNVPNAMADAVARYALARERQDMR